MTAAQRKSVVYVTYDGLLEPLGQSQVLAYMEKLSSERGIHIVSFEKPRDMADATRVAAMRARLAEAQIGWTPLLYHKAPTVPATAYDIARGMLVVAWLALWRRAAILHVRSYVPAMIALPAKWLTGAKLLFDIRGFWADERVDGGLWPKDGSLYRAVKKLERLFIANADYIVTLTHASARELKTWPAFIARKLPLVVIPTCADLDRFSLKPEPARDPFVFGYVGSVGTWYLFDVTVEFFLALAKNRPSARMLVVNRNEHAAIREICERHGVPPDRLEIVAADHGDVPKAIARMHAAAAIIKPSYSKISSAPTKFAEYLGCGVPCVGNVGVGDMEEVLEGRRVGVALRDFSHPDLESAVDRLLALLEEPDLRDRCASVARDLFSLESGVAEYRKVYEALSPSEGRLK